MCGLMHVLRFYHICIGFCSRLPVPTRKSGFILKNLISKLSVACVRFCQQAAEHTTGQLNL